MQENGLIDVTEPIDWGHPLNRGLVALYSAPAGFPFGGATLRNLCGKNHGSLVSDTTWTTGTHEFGSLNIGGSTGYADVVGLPAPSNDFTIVMAVYPTTAGATVDHQTTFSSGNDYAAYVSVGASKLNFYDAGTGTWLTGTLAVPLNEWTLIGCGYTAGTGRYLYVNGKPDTSGLVSGSITWGTSRRLGRRIDNINGSFSGRIESMWFYHRRLGGIEHAAIFQHWKRGFRTPDSPLNFLRPWTLRAEATSPPTPPATVFLPAFAAGW